MTNIINNIIGKTKKSSVEKYLRTTQKHKVHEGSGEPYDVIGNILEKEHY